MDQSVKGHGTPAGEPLKILMSDRKLDKFLWRHSENFQLVEFLRSLYAATEGSQSELAAEREKRLEFVADLKAKEIYSQIEEKWPQLDIKKKARVVELLIHMYADAMGIPRLKFVCPTNIGDDRFFEPVRYRENLSHGPGGSYAEVYDTGADGLLSTFRGALEAFAYLSARHYQCSLASHASIDRTDPRYKLARLYQLEFYRNAVPQAFPWGPGEVERWLGEPGMAHALNAVHDTLAILTGDKNYVTSDSFILGFGRRFHRLWQETLFETQAPPETKLDYYERYLSAASDSALYNIEDTWRRCLIVPLDRAAEISTNLASRAHASRERLISTAPHQFGFRLSLHKSLGETVGLAATFNRRAMEDMTPPDRVTMVKALVREGEPGLKGQARQMALNFLASDPYPPEVEEREDDLILLLKEKIDFDPMIARAQQDWRDIPLDGRLAVMRRVMEIHAATFGYEPAGELTTFRLSREDYEKRAKERGESGKIYPLMVAFRQKPCAQTLEAYPELKLENERGIAINIHMDALLMYIEDYALAEGYIIHEQTHQNDFQENDQLAEGKSLIHPWRESMLRSIASHDSIPRMDKDEELAYAFYRATMTERHAFGLQGKIVHLRKHQLIPSEKTIFVLDLQKRGVVPAML